MCNSPSLKPGSAQIYLFGAVVTSWKQPSGDEVLYVRPDAKFDKSKPISGGIPFCFPQASHQLCSGVFCTRQQLVPP